MFSQVFVYSQGGLGLCPGGSLSRRVSVQGGLCPGEVSVQGVSVRETPQTETPRTVASGRYASYWNVLLVPLYYL